MKKQTIPRMEFMAVVLAGKISNNVCSVLKKKLEISNVIFWCDSQVVLHWILGKGSPDGFVKRRVELVKKMTTGSTWYYCPSKMNPAEESKCKVW